LTRARWLELAAAVGLPARTAARTLDEVVASPDRWPADVATIGFDERRTHKLRQGIEYRRQELAGP
jgi:hypothetical protein